MLRLFSFSTLLLFLSSAHVVAQGSAEPILQTGHLGRIYAIAYGPDGQFALTGSEDKTVRLWSITTGYEIRSYGGHSGTVRAVAFTPDGAQLVSAGDDGTIRLWDRVTGRELRQYLGHAGRVSALAVSADGQTLVSGGEDLLIRVWDLPRGTLRQTIKGHKKAINALTFSKDQRAIASAGADPTESYLWDITTGAQLKRWQFLRLLPNFLFDLQVFSIQLSDDNERLLTAIGSGGDGINNIFSIVLYRSAEGALREDVVVAGGVHGGGAVYARLLPDQKHLLTAGFDRTLRLYDVDSMLPIKPAKQMQMPGRTMRGHRGPILALTTSPDGQYALTASKDNTLRLWHIATGREIRTFRSSYNYVQPYSLSFSQGGRSLLINRRFLPSLRLDLEYARMSVNFTGKEDTDFAAVSPDGKQALSFNKFSKEIKVWNLEQGRLERVLNGHLAAVTYVDYADDGRSILSSSRDRTLIKWDAQTGSILEKIPNRQFRGTLAADGRTALTTRDSTIVVIDFATGAEQRRLVGHRAEVRTATISADARHVISADARGDLRVWDVASGQVLHQLKGHSGEILAVAINNDGSLAASAGDDGRLILWDLTSGSQRAEVFMTGDADYLIRIPGNYYTCSRGAARSLAFRQGERILPFEAFDLRYNQPHRVLRQLGLASPALIASFERAYAKRLARLGFTEAELEAELDPPSVQLPHAQLPLIVREPELMLPITVTAGAEPLKQLSVTVNDVPLFGKVGRRIEGQRWNGRIPIPLAEGLNQIVVSATNSRGVAAIPQYLEVKYESKAPRKPDLYVLAVGVSKYAQTEFDLTYASKDAEDFVKTLQGNPGLFGQVRYRQLTDAQATHAAILAAKADFLSQAKTDDVVIVFVAGHGLLDERFDYFFGTHDIDFDAPTQTGLSYDELEGLLDGLKAQRKLLFLDTCHSGEADTDRLTGVTYVDNPDAAGERIATRGGSGRRKKKGVGAATAAELARALFADLRDGTGAVVISSAGSAEYALESAQWNNGVFTYCLLSGLRERRADYNSDGVVHVSELQRFLVSRVPKLTGGKQTPTGRADNLRIDTRLW